MPKFPLIPCAPSLDPNDPTNSASTKNIINAELKAIENTDASAKAGAGEEIAKTGAFKYGVTDKLLSAYYNAMSPIYSITNTIIAPYRSFGIRVAPTTAISKGNLEGIASPINAEARQARAAVAFVPYENEYMGNIRNFKAQAKEEGQILTDTDIDNMVDNLARTGKKSGIKQLDQAVDAYTRFFKDIDQDRVNIGMGAKREVGEGNYVPIIPKDDFASNPNFIAKFKNHFFNNQNKTENEAVNTVLNVWDNSKGNLRKFLKDKEVDGYGISIDFKDFGERLIDSIDGLDNVAIAEIRKAFAEEGDKMLSTLREYNEEARNIIEGLTKDRHAYFQTTNPEDVLKDFSNKVKQVKVDGTQESLESLDRFAKKRGINLPATDWGDAAHNNPQELMRFYARSYARDKALFQSFGEVSPLAIINKAENQANTYVKEFLDAEYQKVLNGTLDQAKYEKTKVQYERALERDKLNFRSIMEKFSGTFDGENTLFGIHKKGIQGWLNFSTATSMWGSGWSQAPDVAGGAVATLFKPLQPYLTKMGKEMAFSGVDKDQLHKIGLGLARKIAQLNSERSWLAPTLGDEGPVAKVLDKSAKGTLRWSGNVILDTFGSDIVHLNSVDNMLSTAGKLHRGETLSQKDIAELAHIGVDKARAARIQDAIDRFSVEVNNGDGVLIDPRIDLWPDDLQDIFSMIRQQGDQWVAHTDSAAIPHWMSKGLFRPLTQYLSYGVASQNKAAIRLLQTPDVQHLTVAMAKIATSTLITSIRLTMANRNSIIEDDPAKFMSIVIANSGVFGSSSIIGDITGALNAQNSVSAFLLATSPGLGKANQLVNLGKTITGQASKKEASNAVGLFTGPLNLLGLGALANQAAANKLYDLGYLKSLNKENK